MPVISNSIPVIALTICCLCSATEVLGSQDWWFKGKPLKGHLKSVTFLALGPIHLCIGVFSPIIHWPTSFLFCLFTFSVMLFHLHPAFGQTHPNPHSEVHLTMANRPLDCWSLTHSPSPHSGYYFHPLFLGDKGLWSPALMMVEETACCSTHATHHHWNYLSCPFDPLDQIASALTHKGCSCACKSIIYLHQRNQEQHSLWLNPVPQKFGGLTCLHQSSTTPTPFQGWEHLNFFGCNKVECVLGGCPANINVASGKQCMLSNQWLASEHRPQHPYGVQMVGHMLSCVAWLPRMWLYCS